MATATQPFSTGTDSPVGGRLVDMEVLRFEQPQVGRHPVAGGQQHHVARYQAFGVQRLALAVAQDQGMQRKHVADGVQRVGRLALLDETDQRVDHHRQEDYRTVHPEAEQRGDQRGEQHHVQQDVVELPQQAQQRPLAFRRGQSVVAVRRQAAGGFVRVQAGGGAVQSFQHPLRRAGMGVAGRQGGMPFMGFLRLVLMNRTIGQACAATFDLSQTDACS